MHDTRGLVRRAVRDGLEARVEAGLVDLVAEPAHVGVALVSDEGARLFRKRRVAVAPDPEPEVVRVVVDGQPRQLRVGADRVERRAARRSIRVELYPVVRRERDRRED